MCVIVPDPCIEVLGYVQLDSLTGKILCLQHLANTWHMSIFTTLLLQKNFPTSMKIIIIIVLVDKAASRKNAFYIFLGIIAFQMSDRGTSVILSSSKPYTHKLKALYISEISGNFISVLECFCIHVSETFVNYKIFCWILGWIRRHWHNFPCLKLIEIVIVWVHFTIPFRCNFFLDFGASYLTFIQHFVWLRITDEGSITEMRIWLLLLIQSDFKQNRSTEGCSKLKRSVDMTSSGKNGLNIRTNASHKWDRTRCPVE